MIALSSGSQHEVGSWSLRCRTKCSAHQIVVRGSAGHFFLFSSSSFRALPCSYTCECSFLGPLRSGKNQHESTLQLDGVDSSLRAWSAGQYPIGTEHKEVQRDWSAYVRWWGLIKYDNMITSRQQVQHSCRKRYTAILIDILCFSLYDLHCSIGRIPREIK